MVLSLSSNDSLTLNSLTFESRIAARFARLEALIVGSWNLHDMGSRGPKCDGTAPLRWLSKVRDYFEFYDTHPDDRLRCVALMLEGPAADWFRWRMNNGLINDWDDFIEKFKIRFAPLHCVEDAMDEYDRDDLIIAHESSSAWTVPLVVVYSENLADSCPEGSTASSGENSHIPRTTPVDKDKTRDNSNPLENGSTQENHIIQDGTTSLLEDAFDEESLERRDFEQDAKQLQDVEDEPELEQAVIDIPLQFENQAEASKAEQIRVHSIPLFPPTQVVPRSAPPKIVETLHPPSASVISNPIPSYMGCQTYFIEP